MNFVKFKDYLFNFDYTESSKNLKTRSQRRGCWRSVVVRGGGNQRTQGKPPPTTLPHADIWIRFDEFCNYNQGVKQEGDLGIIFALWAKISPHIGLREKWESPYQRKQKKYHQALMTEHVVP